MIGAVRRREFIMLRDAWVWFKTPPASLGDENTHYFTMVSFSSLAGFLVVR